MLRQLSYENLQEYMAEMSVQRKVELVTKDRTYVTSIIFLAKNKIKSIILEIKEGHMRWFRYIHRNIFKRIKKKKKLPIVLYGEEFQVPGSRKRIPYEMH